MQVTQRMLSLPDGRRTSIKLDSPSWQAVDFAAAKREAKWDEWAAGILANTNDVSNMTAYLRAAAIQALLDEVVSGPPDRLILTLQKGRVVSVEAQ